jgi:YcxB-like protein
METFTIKTRLTTKEYAKVMFAGLYKKPAFILSTLLGLYFATTVILNYFKVIEWYHETPIFEIACGIFLLLAPTLIVLISVRQFRSNRSFQNDITYTFGDSGVAVQGLTFKSEFLWSHIIKQKELNKFLILYHSKKFGNFIDKTKLTTDQINFIKSKAEQK